MKSAVSNAGRLLLITHLLFLLLSSSSRVFAKDFSGRRTIFTRWSLANSSKMSPNASSISRVRHGQAKHASISVSPTLISPSRGMAPVYPHSASQSIPAGGRYTVIPSSSRIRAKLSSSSSAFVIKSGGKSDCGWKRLTWAAGIVAWIISVGALGKQARPARPTIMDFRGDHSSSAWIEGKERAVIVWPWN